MSDTTRKLNISVEIFDDTTKEEFETAMVNALNGISFLYDIEEVKETKDMLWVCEYTENDTNPDIPIEQRPFVFMGSDDFDKAREKADSIVSKYFENVGFQVYSVSEEEMDLMDAENLYDQADPDLSEQEALDYLEAQIEDKDR